MKSIKAYILRKTEQRVRGAVEEINTDQMPEGEVRISVHYSSLNYKVQKQYSDTLNLENRSIENLVSNIYQKILLVLSQKI